MKPFTDLIARFLAARGRAAGLPDRLRAPSPGFPNSQPFGLVFDEAFYRKQLHAEQLALADADPLGHYVTTGWKKGLNPHPFFDVRWYLEQNPDVAALVRQSPAP